MRGGPTQHGRPGAQNIVAAQKRAEAARASGFKGDLYWLGVESNIDAAEEWLVDNHRVIEALSALNESDAGTATKGETMSHDAADYWRNRAVKAGQLLICILAAPGLDCSNEIKAYFDARWMVRPPAPEGAK